MPNMIDDGYLSQAQLAHSAALLPGNSDFALQGAVANAIVSAANSGLFTIGVNISAYSTTLVQLMVQRLINMGYTASLSATVLTVNW